MSQATGAPRHSHQASAQQPVAHLPAGHEQPRIPLFLDCDPGIDDAIALGYLACQSDVDTIGVAASGGNVSTDAVTRAARGWLHLLGRADIPVHRGASLPLVPPEGPVIYADDTHGPAGTGHAVLPLVPETAGPRAAEDLLSVTDSPSAEGSLQAIDSLTAAQAWVRAARTYPGELIGVVTGPCTNVALALEIEPELPRLLRRLVIMGGAFNYRGNTKPTTEWNTDFDPESTARVYAQFATATHLPLIAPLEATESVVMTPQRLATLTQAHPPHTPWGAWLAHLSEALRFYFEFHEADGLGYLAHIHDPFALAVALEWARQHPARQRSSHQVLASTEATPVPQAEPAPPSSSESTHPAPWSQTAFTRVDVELSGTLTRGETVADWLGRWGKPANAELIRSIDAASFLQHLLDTLRRGPTP